MVIALGHEPTREEGAAFLSGWDDLASRRRRWLSLEIGEPWLDGSARSLDPALAWLADQVGTPGVTEEVPTWYGPDFAALGWTPYGAALVEALVAYLDGIYRDRLGDAAVWVLETDTQSPDLHRPVPRDRRVPPSWRQVPMALRRLRLHGGPAGPLRIMAEEVLAQVGGASGSDEEGAGAATQREPWVGVAPTGRGQWQASFPDDIDRRLGAAYPDLEDVLASVEGVTGAVMEDRDSALVTTRRGVDGADLQRRLTAAVAALAARES